MAAERHEADLGEGTEVVEKENAELRLEQEDKFRLFHLKAVIISGVGFFTDAYDLQVISSVQTQMAMARWPGQVKAAFQGDLAQHGPGNLPTVTSLNMSCIALVGTLCGQVVFGVLGDRLGRKGAYGVTLGLMILMTILQVVGAWGSEDLFTGLFLLWRFWLGVGIGGDYPLSAVISSEYASTRLRGPMIAAVNSMQGLGALSAACIGMAVTTAYTDSVTKNCNATTACTEMDAMWRIIMGLGAILAVLTFYLRLKLPESPRFTSQVDHDVELAERNVQTAIQGHKADHQQAAAQAEDRITMKSFLDFICRRRNFLTLVGTASCWFCMNTSFYSQSLFTPDILTNIGFNPSLTTKSTGAEMATKAYKTCAGNGIILLCGTVPGYYPTIFLINRIGRMPLQKLGFSVMMVTLVIMAAAYPQLLPSANNPASINGTPWAYLMLFCLMFFFTNFGPNTTCFLVPGELYPTKFRTTCHGISAACGKLGAIAGSFGFGWIVVGAKNHISSTYPMDTTTNAMQLSVGLLAIMAALGLACSFLVPETKDLSLEEIVAKYFDYSEDGEEQSERVKREVSGIAAHSSDGNLAVGKAPPPAPEAALPLTARTQVVEKENAELRLEQEDKFRLFHLKAVIISGVGFFTDAYDLQVISSVQTQMAMARWPGQVKAAFQGDLAQHGPGNLPTVTSLNMSCIALVGTLCGQVVFGVLGDRLGRKGAYGVTLGLMILMTILQVVGAWGSQDLFTGLFLLWRFWLGVGIGGDYPLSAVISSEYASTRLRGPMIAAVNLMQGLGALSAACIGMAVTTAYTDSVTNNCNATTACTEMDAMWRIIMGLGAIPAVLTFYLRLKLPESPRFTSQVDHDVELAERNVQTAIQGHKADHQQAAAQAEDRITMRSFRDFICRRRNFLTLVGTASCWFCMNTSFYSQSLFTPDILTNIGFNPSLTTKSTGAEMATKAYKTCAGNGIILLCGTVPGYYPTIFLINRIGRMPLQKLGFSVMMVTLVVMAAAYPQLLPSANNPASINGTPWAYLMLFCLMFFFTNFGPNTTCFLVPGELYPTKFRTTCHGISAACGKLGAIAGSFGFGWIVVGAKNHISSAYPMDTTTNAMQLSVGLLAIMAAVGLACSFLVPETKDLSLEEIVAKYFDYSESAYAEAEQNKDVIVVAANSNDEEEPEVQEPPLQVVESKPSRAKSAW